MTTRKNNGPRPMRETLIYKAKRGNIFDPSEAGKKYNCYRPALTGSFYIVDCWVCDEAGNIHPGYNAKPVPVHVDNIGAYVNKVS